MFVQGNQALTQVNTITYVSGTCAKVSDSVTVTPPHGPPWKTLTAQLLCAAAATADLIRTDRFQQSRGRTRQRSQRLHSPDRTLSYYMGPVTQKPRCQLVSHSLAQTTDRQQRKRVPSHTLNPHKSGDVTLLSILTVLHSLGLLFAAA